MDLRELPPGETALAYTAMLELRPHLGSEADFVATVDRVQRPEGYRLVAAFAEGEREAAAAAGFRVAHMLSRGRYLYCDDLSTRDRFRRQGHAAALIQWMLEEARRLDCAELHLDSGVGENRMHAHRLYFASGMRIAAHHFERRVD